MQSNGFLGSLFDLSFREFVTPKVIRLLFVLIIVLGGLWTLSTIVTAFQFGVGFGLGTLVISPVLLLISVLGARVWCELTMVLFRIADNTDRLVKQEESAGSEPASRAG